MKKIGISRKKKTYGYQERDEVKRQEFQQKLKTKHPNQFVYVDEAGSEKQFAFLNLLIRFFQFKCLGLPLTEMVKQASNDEADNVHMLLDFHPKNSIAALTGSLKSSTASILEKEFPQEVQKYHWSKVSFCSNSYYIASCGGFANRSFKEIYPKSR